MLARSGRSSGSLRMGRPNAGRGKRPETGRLPVTAALASSAPYVVPDIGPWYPPEPPRRRTGGEGSGVLRWTADGCPTGLTDVKLERILPAVDPALLTALKALSDASRLRIVGLLAA